MENTQENLDAVVKVFRSSVRRQQFGDEGAMAGFTDAWITDHYPETWNLARDIVKLKEQVKS